MIYADHIFLDMTEMVDVLNAFEVNHPDSRIVTRGALQALLNALLRKNAANETSGCEQSFIELKIVRL